MPGIILLVRTIFSVRVFSFTPTVLVFIVEMELYVSFTVCICKKLQRTPRATIPKSFAFGEYRELEKTKHFWQRVRLLRDSNVYICLP